MSDELTKLSALAVRDLLMAGEVSSIELVEAAAARLAIIEPQLNAVPTLCLDRAMEQAGAADAARRAGRASLLGGLPIVVKDNNDVEGVRNTGGTSIFRDRVSAESDRTVALMEANGAITLGKSNLSGSAVRRPPTASMARRGTPMIGA